jgi:predicted RNA binding protein YcfA (HicA-like mRNA interferase family)
MGSLPVLKPAEVLNRLGSPLVRQRGAHHQFKDQSGRFTTVPFHQGRDIAPPPLLRQIAKDIGMTVEALLEHR